MSKLTIVADILAKPDQIDFLESALERLIPPTLEEEGCLQYDLHLDNENPAHFLFYENWASRELWLKHMEAPHIKNHIAATEDAVESVSLYEMTHVEEHAPPTASSAAAGDPQADRSRSPPSVLRWC